MLIATDVLAEGLDIHTAGRVVHYDLPWNEVRLEQRNGRAVRSGSKHSRVEVVQFQPAHHLEARLAILAALEHKSHMAERLGLGVGRRDRWRWRAALAEACGQVQSAPSVAGLQSGQPPSYAC